jgi:transcriptional regulator with XRE-family HTH domain
MELGARLKKARESKRLSQNEVSHLLGVSQKTLSNIESGKSIPNIFHLAKMSEIYKLDLLEFLAKQGVFLTKNPTTTITITNFRLNPIWKLVQN